MEVGSLDWDSWAARWRSIPGGHRLHVWSRRGPPEAPGGGGREGLWDARELRSGGRGGDQHGWPMRPTSRRSRSGPMAWPTARARANHL